MMCRFKEIQAIFLEEKSSCSLVLNEETVANLLANDFRIVKTDYWFLDHLYVNIL